MLLLIHMAALASHETLTGVCLGTHHTQTHTIYSQQYPEVKSV